MIPVVLATAGALLLYGLFARKLERSFLSAPIVVTVAGALSYPFVSHEDAEAILHFAAEVTLVVILFGDASRIPFSELRKDWSFPVRLLGVALPLSIGLGTVVAHFLFPTLAWLECLLLGALLAPTNAALGQAVVTLEEVPSRIRYALNAESGLNDGLAFPLVVTLLPLAMMGEGLEGPQAAMMFAGKQVILGPLMGAFLAFVIAKAYRAAQAAGFTEPVFERLAGISTAAVCYLAAEAVGGNGFISAFVGGLVFGNVAPKLAEVVHGFVETEGQLLSLGVLALFGACTAIPVLIRADAAVWVYALLSLTVVRMLPVAIGFIGSSVRPVGVLFLGWFGPRGLATILFALMVHEHTDFVAGGLIFDVAVVTVVLSILLHGITAYPLSVRFGALVERNRSSSTDELHTGPTLRPRFRSSLRRPKKEKS